MVSTSHAQLAVTGTETPRIVTLVDILLIYVEKSFEKDFNENIHANLSLDFTFLTEF